MCRLRTKFRAGGFARPVEEEMFIKKIGLQEMAGLKLNNKKEVKYKLETLIMIGLCIFAYLWQKKIFYSER